VLSNKSCFTIATTPDGLPKELVTMAHFMGLLEVTLKVSWQPEVIPKWSLTSLLSVGCWITTVCSIF